MYSAKIVKSIIDDLKRITKADYCLCGADGHKLASTFEKNSIKTGVIETFIESGADSQNIDGYYFFRVKSSKGDNFVLAVNAYGGDGYMFGRIALSELTHLLDFGDEASDRGDFFRALINDSLLPSDMEREAGRLKLQSNKERNVYTIKIESDYISLAREMLENMYSDEKNDYVFGYDEQTLILIKALDIDEAEMFGDIAEEILSMINTELMIQARISYGKHRKGLAGIRESFLEASMAMEIADIFFEERPIVSYQSLGLGRIIYQLPMSLCELFMEETFGEKKEECLDAKEREIIESFFENNLSIAEVSRQLDIKRSTLVHRVDVILKKTGLDIRKFEDAMTVKVALMVAKYMAYRNNSNV